MQNWTRFLPISILWITCRSHVFGQNNQNLIYSRFGPGEIVKNISGAERALGGAGFSLWSNDEINFLNPASHTAIKDTYGRVYLNIALSDLWFVKRKID